MQTANNHESQPAMKPVEQRRQAPCAKWEGWNDRQKGKATRVASRGSLQKADRYPQKPDCENENGEQDGHGRVKRPYQRPQARRLRRDGAMAARWGKRRRWKHGAGPKVTGSQLMVAPATTLRARFRASERPVAPLQCPVRRHLGRDSGARSLKRPARRRGHSGAEET